MNFMFEWQEQYLTSERILNISDFISSSQVLQIRLGFIANRKYSSSCFLLRVFVFKFFCKLFNFFVADGRKPACHAFILNNKRDARNQFNKSKRRES